MTTIVKTDSTNKDFIELVKQLDAYLAIMDGVEHAFYDQFNKVDTIKNVLVAYDDDKSVGCGAIKQFSKEAMEVKRMYTLPESRGKGIATKILTALENWASELNYKTCILETGKRQTEAIELYKKCGYKIIENYGQYAGIVNSICFEKHLNT